MESGDSSHGMGCGKAEHNKNTLFLVSFLLSLGLKSLTLSQKAKEKGN